MKFELHAQGDRTVGDGDHQVIVDIPYMAEDREYVAYVISRLEQTFSEIFMSRARVVQINDKQR